MSVYDAKTPPTDRKEHYIGLEIEAFSYLTFIQVGEILEKSANADKYHLGEDGSIEPDNAAAHSFELKIIFPQKELFKTVRILCEDLKNVEARVNKTCGMHVHLDMKARKKMEVFARLVKEQDTLFSLVKKERKTSFYCQPVPAALSFDRTYHYSAINGSAAFAKHGTIEVRLHHGTTKMFEILNFIRLIVAIADNKPIGMLLKHYIHKQKKLIA